MKWLYIFLALTVLIAVILFTAGLFMFNLALSRSTDKTNVKKGLKRYGKNNNKTPEHPRFITEELKEWFFNTTEKVNITSNGNLLQGYILRQPEYTDKWSIVLHGWTAKSTEMIKYGKKFFENSYNVLFIDLAAHGNSEGKFYGMGWKDKDDLKKWIDVILNEDQNAKIVLYGVSMGASTVMMTCGETLPKNVIACIEDCGFTSVWDILKFQFKKNFKNLPSFPILNIASIISKIKLGYSFKEASVLKQFKKNSSIPMLFIHGDSDTFVPTYMVNILYNAYPNENKDIFIVKNAEHINSWAEAKDKYFEKIFDFIDKYI